MDYIQRYDKIIADAEKQIRLARLSKKLCKSTGFKEGQKVVYGGQKMYVFEITYNADFRRQVMLTLTNPRKDGSFPVASIKSKTIYCDVDLVANTIVSPVKDVKKMNWKTAS